MQGRDNRNARGLATARSIERFAVELAALHGADAVTVDEICAAVGISQRTFFNHFDTKEDALLGLELPRINEQRAREYLADPKVGLLTGALAIVELPREHSDDPELAMLRVAVLTSSPSLARRQTERMTPLIGEVAEVVLLKLTAMDTGMPPSQLRTAARTITTIAASLMIQLGDTTAAEPAHLPLGPAERLGALQGIWSRML